MKAAKRHQLAASEAEPSTIMTTIEQVSAENEQLRALLEQAPAVLCVLRGPTHVYELANAQFLQLVGHRDIVGKPIREALPELEGQGFFELLDGVYESGQAFVGNEMVVSLDRRGDGSQAVAYFNFVYQPLRDASGGVSGVMVHATEVTELVESKRLAQALNEELAAQTMELQAQQEELSRVNEELRRHSEEVEALVAARTEELQASNEELAAQTEELAAQRLVIEQANAEASSRRRFLEVVVERLPGGLAYLDRDYNFILANPAYARFLGKPLDEIAGSYTWALLPEAEETIRPIYESVRTSRQPLRGAATPVPVREGDSIRETFWDFSINPIEDEAGNFDGWLVLCFEVSERIKLEREIDQRKDMLERVIESAPTGISYMTKDLVYEWANPVQARLWGIPVDKVIRRSLFDVFGQEAGDAVAPLLRGVVETGEPFTGEAFPFTYMVDGEPRTSYWDFTYQPVRGDNSQIDGIMVLASEVSSVVERERLQAAHIEQLKASERIKDEFLSVISHELRTPLNFIMGFASILEDEVHGPLNEGQLTAVSRILNGADRMVVLVDDLLDYAKLQAGKFDLAPGPTPYGPLVADALAMMQPLAAQRGIRLTHDLHVPGTPVLDAGRITQVLTNLVSNALKFTDAGGQVTVRARLHEGLLRTEVSDTGCGIRPEDIPRLFQRFQQLDMSSTRRAGGTGLGLAITKAIVEAHGGQVGVESERGRGTTFWFTLPLAG